MKVNTMGLHSSNEQSLIPHHTIGEEDSAQSNSTRKPRHFKLNTIQFEAPSISDLASSKGSSRFVDLVPVQFRI